MRKTFLIVVLLFVTLVSQSLSIPTFANPIEPEGVKSAALDAPVTLVPVADSFVNARYPNDNHGADPDMRVDSDPVISAYLRFNVSGVSGAVSKATLRLYASNNLSSGIVVKRVANNSWDEMSINYNNAPAIGTKIAASGAVTAGAWFGIDVTSYVTGNGTFSFAIINPNATSLRFDSRQGTNKPQLVVTSATAPTPTATVQYQPTATRVPPTATKIAPTATPTATPSGSKTCTFTIGTGVTTADGFGNYSAVKPGNTVCIAAGNRTGLKLINFKGTATAPITFVNSGGKVVISGATSGIQLYGSQHVHITGTGDPATAYGIEIANASNAGVETNHPGTSGKLDGTEYIELDHLYIHNVRAGFLAAKNDDLMDTGIVWSGHQFYIHDNYIKTTNAEGMYIGTSDTHGSFPIYDVQVWNNRLEDTGFDAVQIRQAHTRVLVHHNFINGTGRDPRKNGTIDNTAGFNIAKGTDAGEWYDNTVIGARTAFFIKDSANVRVYNNLAIDSGHSTPYSAPEGAVQIINAKNVQYMFNTIVNTKVNGAYGISINGSTGVVHDNIVGGTFGSLIAGAGMTLTNNQVNKDVTSFKFVNVGGQDLHLTSTSPAVNTANDSTFPKVDMDNMSRPQGTKSDVGAYEYH